MDTSSNSPDYQNLELIEMKKKSVTCRNVILGDEKMRKEYLEQYEGESDDGFLLRKKTSYVKNKLDDKITKSTGLILNKQVEYNKDVPQYLINDTDNVGSTISQFSEMLLKDGLIDGHSFILIDAPQSVANLQEQISNNIHPFWINTVYTNVLNWKFGKVGGDTKLIRATVRQLETADNGEFGQKQIEVFKIYYFKDSSKNVYYKSFQRDTNETQKRDVNNIESNINMNYSTSSGFSPLVEETMLNITDIPLVPFYADKVRNFESKPPFYNTAMLNIEMFQLSSQKKRALKQVCDPDKAIFSDNVLNSLARASKDTGGATDSSLTFGADVAQVFGTSDKYTYVEPTGRGVELISLDIKDIEEHIDKQSVSLAQTNVTATQANIDNTNNASEDITFSYNLEGALNKAYEITRQFDISLPEIDKPFSINRDFAKPTLDAQTLTALTNMHTAGIISQSTLLESIATGILPNKMTQDEIDEEIAKTDLESMSGLNNGNL